MSVIKKVYAREVLDSRGNPTVEVEVTLDNGVMGRATVPSGASTGENEALELRDGNPKRYLGKGVLAAVYNVNNHLSKVVIGMNPREQQKIDKAMIEADGTPFKKRFGANAILGVSLAVCHAAANDAGIPLYKYLNNGKGNTLPVPMMNVINGGAHADNNIDFQEFMIMPIGAKSVKESIRMGSEVFHTLKGLLKSDGEVTSVGDEGGFAPNLKDNEEPLKYIVKAITKAGYIPGVDFVIAMDVAASEFYDKETHKYDFRWSHHKPLTTKQMVNYLIKLCEKYPIVSIEDGLSEEDYEGHKLLTDKISKNVQLVGDDLFVTNPKIFREGINMGLCNAILIKLNQIGTVSETIQTIRMAAKANYKAIISHRSGETEDTSIAHFAVAFNTGEIKTGSMSRTDRIAKYNELMRIEESLGKKAKFPGKKAFNIKF